MHGALGIAVLIRRLAVIPAAAQVPDVRNRRVRPAGIPLGAEQRLIAVIPLRHALYLRRSETDPADAAQRRHVRRLHILRYRGALRLYLLRCHGQVSRLMVQHPKSVRIGHVVKIQPEHIVQRDKKLQQPAVGKVRQTRQGCAVHLGQQRHGQAVRPLRPRHITGQVRCTAHLALRQARLSRFQPKAEHRLPVLIGNLSLDFLYKLCICHSSSPLLSMLATW